MQIKPVAAALLGAALMLGGVAARADDAAQTLAQNLGKGMASATSFQAVLDGAHGITSTLTYNRGGRMAMNGAMGPMKFEMVNDMASKTTYMRFNGGAWMFRKSDGDSTPQYDISKYTGEYKGAQLTPLPDRVEGGTTYGAFQTKGAPPSGPMGGGRSTEGSMTCTYDKTSFRLHVCSFGDKNTTTMTYSHWDDPANVIAIPKDAQPFSPSAMMGGMLK